MTEQEIIHRHNAARARHAVSFVWAKRNTEERKELAAVAQYARKVKLVGKEKADEWLALKFPQGRSQELLKLPVFKRQWIKYL